MDDILVQWCALATILASAMTAVLAFSHSGWRSTVGVGLLVVGAGSVGYFVLFSGWGERQAVPSGARVSAAIAPPPDRSWTASLPALAAEVPPSPGPYDQSPRSDANRTSPVLASLNSTETPTPLAHRYPSVYSPSEVAECPRCRTPYSAAGATRGVVCPTCSQVVDLLPAGRYSTIHCCCGKWIQSPFCYPAPGPNGGEHSIPYFCPRCRAHGTITDTRAKSSR